ncbi:Ribosomal protein L7Ae/L30e/S12e/Gadd45 [Penicillium bovifimosum]|uniref:H/ACA ribonucleoprotein complex subunit 2 n=1 Tax=Penicillium bovifimosum TaxID=126998 RepID=A0A9W9L1P0_9EURO|nr:Ribosomal protein L7Ae/L30e/S12e/Gadd45 [Penicillium bovifimosum]KAJ5131421.1 Ribosomal protein L7Ae/L30e/S12e/Gadd45 [Penicillium bovifimosum]
MSVVDHRPAVWPTADPGMTEEILDLVQQASHYGQIKRGVNEVMKSITRFTAEIVVIAADTTPLALASPLPLLCEGKDIAYVWVPSKIALGRSCGLSRPVVAVSLTANKESTLSPQITLLKSKVNQLAI